MAMKNGALAVLGALTLAACGGSPADPDAVTQVEWTKAIQFCRPTSYCTSRLLVSGGEAVLTFESREAPAVRVSAPLDSAQRAAFAHARAQVRFDGLPGTIGCAGCLDGPVETLTLAEKGMQHKVTFGGSAAVPELEPLLGEVRALVVRLTPMPTPMP